MPYFGLNADVDKDVFTKFKINLLARGVTITDILSVFIERIANDINVIDQFKKDSANEIQYSNQSVSME